MMKLRFGCRGAGVIRLPSHSRGFTLMELLVVVAIIGILAAMIIPTVGRMQERGRLVQCTSNLKQLHTAVISFQHNNDTLPSAYSEARYDSGGVRNANKDRKGWVHSFPDGEGEAWWYEKNGEEGSWSVINGSLFEYVGDQNVYVCPNMSRYARKRFDGDKRYVTRSYGMNFRIHKANIAGVDGASRTFLFADQGLIDMGGGRTYLNKRDDGGYDKPAPTDDNDGYFRRFNTEVDGAIDYDDDDPNNDVPPEWIGAYHGRNAHEQGEEGGVANVVFVDGHVEQVPYAYTDYVGDGDWEDGEPIK